MGKSQKPLVIVTYPPISEWPELADLEAQGHTIIRRGDADVPMADLYLGPECHRMSEDLRKYLPLALAEGRRVKYGKGGKDGT